MPSAVKRLHDAASRGDCECLQKLLRGGIAKVNAKSSGGVGVLEGELVDCADVNAKNKAGWAALHIAAQNGHADALAVLLAAAGVDVNARNKDGWVALHIAAQNGHTNSVKVLLAANGIDVNATNNDGWSALHFAAQNNYADALKVLLAANGVDVNAKNQDRTAANLAAAAGNIDALKFLVAHGADLNASTRNSAADVATGDCVTYLAQLAKQTLPSLRRKLTLIKSHLERANHKLTCKLEEATRSVQEKEAAVAAAAEASLSELIQDVAVVMDGPDGWASPLVDPAGEAQWAVNSFVKAYESLSTSLADAAVTSVDASVTAQHRADCCTAATVLLEQLPLSENGESMGIPAAPRAPTGPH